MIQFRFPIAVAYYCSKNGFPDAVKRAMRFAICPRSVSSEDFRNAARDFVDNCMKARIASFEARSDA